MLEINEKQLISFLEKKYPYQKAENWDFVGYSLERKNKNGKLNKILLCLDVNKFSINKAITEKVNLIISFHPFCFAPNWEDIFKYDPTKKELIRMLEKNKISVYSIHTNFDQDKKGTKYWFIKKLGLDNKIIKNFKFASILLFEKSFENLVDLLKNKLNLNFVLSNYSLSKNTTINKIYICPGAGDIYEFIKKNKKEKVDILITSDIKWNEQQVLNSNNINFIQISHKTEDVFVEGMFEIIKEKFPNLEIIKFIQNDFIKGY